MSASNPVNSKLWTPADRLSRDAVGLLTQRWLASWGILLAGLAIGGRGFAYIGLPPLFISEIVVITGVLVLLLQPRWRELLSQPTILLILVLMGWSLLQTLSYLGSYRLDAIRDYMIVGYAVVGISVAGIVISRPDALPWLLSKYQTFVKVFLCVMPGLFLISKTGGEAIPTWPWASHVPMVDLKPGDMPVHLGGIAALSVLGLFRGRSVLWLVLLCLLVGITGAESRGGLLSFTLAFSIALSIRPRSVWPFRILAVVLVLMSVALITDVRAPMGDRDREFSARQLILNFASVVENDDMGDLDDTKEWRLAWWNDIVGYTVKGEHFWTGKGFGVNLATADGYQVNEQETLRSPHNGHMTILARAGVPGLVLWIAIQISWLTSMANAYLTARRRRDSNWAMWFGLLTAYWAALMLNAAVDVYFEGPMGGIWYWSIIGLGVASVWVFRHHPQIMHLDHATPREVSEV